MHARRSARKYSDFTLQLWNLLLCIRALRHTWQKSCFDQETEINAYDILNWRTSNPSALNGFHSIGCIKLWTLRAGRQIIQNMQDGHQDTLPVFSNHLVQLAVPLLIPDAFYEPTVNTKLNTKKKFVQRACRMHVPARKHVSWCVLLNWELGTLVTTTFKYQ